jgi:hypothetical protein
MTTQPAFQPGFRLSKSDVAVLALGAIGAFRAAQVDMWLGIVVAFTVGHFFLFCNVVRMARPLELVWAVTFVFLCTASLLYGMPPWPVTLAISLALTCVLVVLQVRSPAYHGVLWERFNPKLRAWWEAQALPPADASP